MAAIMDNTPYNNLVDGQKEKIWQINETKAVYGFADREVILEEGKKYIFSARGNISQEAKNAGKKLRVYLWSGQNNTPNGEWIFGQALEFSNLTPEVKSKEITNIPVTGKYYLASYCYPGPSVGNVTAEWYKLEDADAVDVVVTNVSRNKWKYLGVLAITALIGLVVYKKFFSKKK